MTTAAPARTTPARTTRTGRTRSAAMVPSTVPNTVTGAASPPTAPPLASDLLAALARMRLPYLRAAAPEVLATARAQRWDPAEVVKVLLAEEIRGRDEATRRMRRKSAGLPAGKTFDSWRQPDSSIP